MSRKQREKRARAKGHASEPRETQIAPEPSTATPAEGSAGSLNKLGLVVAVVALVGLFGVVLFLGDPPPPDPDAVAARGADNEPDESAVELWEAAEWNDVPVDASRDFIRGPANAAVTIVEFTDFQCPFCKTAYTYLDEIVERYPADVRLVFKNLPLDIACNADVAHQLHRYACKAAGMARCAGARDPEMFWQFHDAIFESDGFNGDWLDAKAAELGLVDETFQGCVTGSDTFDEVRADIELARTLDVYATPTFYVNGRVVPSYEIDDLSEIIDHILDSD